MLTQTTSGTIPFFSGDYVRTNVNPPSQTAVGETYLVQWRRDRHFRYWSIISTSLSFPRLL